MRFSSKAPISALSCTSYNTLIHSQLLLKQSKVEFPNLPLDAVAAFVSMPLDLRNFLNLMQGIVGFYSADKHMGHTIWASRKEYGNCDCGDKTSRLQ
jgi:hypothetical protein